MKGTSRQKGKLKETGWKKKRVETEAEKKVISVGGKRTNKNGMKITNEGGAETHQCRPGNKKIRPE